MLWVLQVVHVWRAAHEMWLSSWWQTLSISATDLISLWTPRFWSFSGQAQSKLCVGICLATS